jgi:hypothetical protein
MCSFGGYGRSAAIVLHERARGCCFNPVMLSPAMASSGTPKVCSAKMTMQGTAGDNHRNTRQKKEGQKKYAPDIAPY